MGTSFLFTHTNVVNVINGRKGIGANYGRSLTFRTVSCILSRNQNQNQKPWPEQRIRKKKRRMKNYSRRRCRMIKKRIHLMKGKEQKTNISTFISFVS